MIIKFLNTTLVQNLYSISNMKDLNQIVEGGQARDNQNDSNKDTAEPTNLKPQVSVNKDNTTIKDQSIITDLTKSTSKGSLDNSTADKASKPINKKDIKANDRNAMDNLHKKGKTEGENIIQKVVDADHTTKSKQGHEKLNAGVKPKEKIKVIKKAHKKAEETVNKLQKKVKKALKKEVKTSQLKGLKEKLEKAFQKLKMSISKLKKEKNNWP